MSLRPLVATAALLLSAIAHAQTPTPAELERALAGRWAGHLEYRDYQNDRRYRLPMQTTLTVADDGATLTRQSRFDDGPGRGDVLITTVSLYDAAGTGVTSASFRRGRGVETVTESARVVEHAGPTEWVAEWSRRGVDGQQPADIRITLRRRGDELHTVKEVREPRAEGSPAAPWVFRNETLLRRQP